MKPEQPKDNLFDEITNLLRKCEEIIDDDLENKPARHSLGNLNARLRAVIVRIEK